MQPRFLSALLAVLLVSSLAWVCLLTVRLSERRMQALMPWMVSATVGILSGEALFHLFPDARRGGLSVAQCVLFVGFGGLDSLLFEKFVSVVAEAKGNPLAAVAIAAESAHNAVDGAVIAVAFMQSASLGWLTTFAVVCHEIPHEFGNFAVLLHTGISRPKAIVVNVLCGAGAFTGALLVGCFGKPLMAYKPQSLAVVAGCFLYLSIIGLLPTLLKKHRDYWPRIGVGLTAGVVLMAVLTVAR